ncbi:SH3 domain-containing protein [Winogradskyella bathintestinalis]|uniref:SH3 domain-containing protein n=1 Tax=Winogradskyella bathintestinalis TaxID=3035208 RepID=A0ABT7ZQX8_9FLAO|nr:SH3 domain-containing protein [Winogradskyella bathintestinalis]MDN3491392.1 SH3 domain-containing protein [Winogradskyella bathintestinalis]
MNNLKQILAIGMLLCATLVTAQQNAYVAAESGLSLRDQPDVNGKLLTKLAYAEAIGVLEETDIKLIILDGGKKVSGNWVKVETRNHIGYVFNGYLSATKISKPIRLDLGQLHVEIKNLATSDYKRTHGLKKQDSTTIHVELGATPEGKQILLINNDYKHVSIFQSYENSISFMSSDAQCDAKDWKHFDSEWKPLKQITSNTFQTLTYTENDWKKFIDMSMNNLKTEIIHQCGEDWLNYFKTIKNLKDHPVGVATNRVFLKIILTDFENNITEKVIEFDIPQGC